MISLRARVCLSIKHLLFRALVILSMSLQTRAAEPTNIFPIMPWNSPPNDLAVLKKIHDCGFTLAGFVAPAGLPLCEQAELQAIVIDPTDKRSVGRLKNRRHLMRQGRKRIIRVPDHLVQELAKLQLDTVR